MSYNSGFISDHDLLHHVQDTLSRLTRKINLCQFEKNIIDPIRLVFDIHAYNKTPEQTIDSEVSIQLGKTLENAIGWFHQYIFTYIKGWNVPGDGVDVINAEGTIFGEIKNKYNTRNSSSAAKVFEKLKVIDDVQRENPSTQFENTVLNELSQRNPNLVKSIFLSSFSTYKGFLDLNECG